MTESRADGSNGGATPPAPGASHAVATTNRRDASPDAPTASHVRCVVHGRRGTERARRPVRRRHVAVSLAAGVLTLGLLGASALPPLGPPLERLPMDPPLVSTGGFGETRANHFHAGFDFSTGGAVGRPVLAPGAGWVERVRASGVGYGRSIYLKLHDGRLIVYGHLDAFADPVAAYVDSAQRVLGQYEQDLWPEGRRFPVKAGQVVAWSGNSGAGGPHLHVEVRRGDFALHPLRAGFPLLKPAAPRLDSVTFDPLDDTSTVARRAGPVTRRLGSVAETLLVHGRVRATLKVEDTGEGGATTPPWSASATWAGGTTEIRFDSLSWAGDMSEIDHVFDRGRVSGTRGLVLHAAAGFRPRAMLAPGAADREAGVLVVRPGEPARELVMFARHPDGTEIRRTIWLRGPRAGELGPDTTARGGAPAGGVAWRFASLPDRHLRVRVTGAPEGLSRVRIERGDPALGGRPATWDGSGWSAVLAMAGLPDEDGFWLRGVKPDGGEWSTRGVFQAWPGGADLPIRPEVGLMVVIPPASTFERGVALTAMGPLPEASGQGLVARSAVLRLLPESLPLRASATITIPQIAGTNATGVAIYQRTAGEDWSLLRTTYDEKARTFTANASKLGEFALFSDTRAPRVALQPAPTTGATTPYSRWALTASVTEEGSGVDASTSYLMVDGRRVPTEWDPEARVLRWKPRVRPADGEHSVEAIARDRAGLEARAVGRFRVGRVVTSRAR